VTKALPADATLKRLTLRVRDLDKMLAYYVGGLGFQTDETQGSTVTLRLDGARFSIDLVHEPDAPLRGYPCPGLYHFALVVPDRPALGAIFRHLIERGVEFEGMADHLVSEALYIRDPEGNGIELYRDRPRDEWTFTNDGALVMASDPIDAEGIIASASGPAVLDAQTRLGHIHMHVRDLADAEHFYEVTLGLNRTASIPGALFFAAGDYHHHVGANTWAPDRPVPEGATGLIDYTWLVPDAVAREPVLDPMGATVLFENS
jgi:catechol 2,3-dioxygenase